MVQLDSSPLAQNDTTEINYAALNSFTMLKLYSPGLKAEVTPDQQYGLLFVVSLYGRRCNGRLKALIKNLNRLN